MLTTLFEKTFLVYQGASNKQRGAQWLGWEQFILDYCQKDDYRVWWNSVVENQKGDEGGQYDLRFERFMTKKFSYCKAAY